MEERKSIPLIWIFNYIDSLPDDSSQKNAVVDMFVKWAKEQESEVRR